MPDSTQRSPASLLERYSHVTQGHRDKYAEPVNPEFRLLGPLEVTLSGNPVKIDGARQRKLLTILLLNANRVVPVDQLVGELWHDPPQTVRQQIAERLEDAELRDLAWRLFAGTMEWRGMLDERIQSVAENWTLARMAPTDRNVLRLGAFELLQTDTPYQVVLDEAIDLARKFGTAQSPQFVNGILDRLVPEPKRRAPGV